jgi:hypothetical protein
VTNASGTTSSAASRWNPSCRSRARARCPRPRRVAVGTTSPRRSPTVHPGLAAGGLPICRLLRGAAGEESGDDRRRTQGTTERSVVASTDWSARPSSGPQKPPRGRPESAVPLALAKVPSSRASKPRGALDALRRLVAEDLSVRASADRVGRQLPRGPQPHPSNGSGRCSAGPERRRSGLA